MSDIFLRNIDLMQHATQRAAPTTHVGSTPRFTKMIWDDFILPNFTPTKLRNQSIPYCTSITIQIGNITPAPPAGAPWPVVTVRDANIAPANPLAALNGFEMIPGQWISFQADDQPEPAFLDPTNLWLFFSSVLTCQIHVCYGVLS